MTRRGSLTVGFLALLLGLCALASPSPGIAAAPDEIRIGATAPLTGPAAEAGVALRQGIILAVEEWNAKGVGDIQERPKRDILGQAEGGIGTNDRLGFPGWERAERIGSKTSCRIKATWFCAS
jgi:hypothetical protein